MKNKTFRLFISSTFSDFNLERNILNGEVSQVINDYCQSYGYNFQLIDLRWGVNSESSLNQNTLAICLDEVKRCRTLSPKPNFLILAGERYGWVPLPSKIGAADFQVFLSSASKKDQALLSEWYLWDENEIGGEYYLKFRSDEYKYDKIWRIKEDELRAALLRCISAGPCTNTEYQTDITASATEREILEGLLGCEGVASNTIAIFRDNYSEKDDDQSRIIHLRNRIIEKLKQDGCDDNILSLEYTDTSAYKEKFKTLIIDALKRNIEAEIHRLEMAIAENDDDTPAQILASAPILFERSDEIKYLHQYMQDHSRKPLFLFGESGSGKSTLLAEFIKKAKSTVFYAFYGWSADSYTLLSSLNLLIQQIKKYYGIAKDLHVNETNISEVVYDAIYSIPKDDNAIIIIDGLDAFHDISTIQECVFPSLLPDNVKLILSSADFEIIDRFSGPNRNCYELSHFDSEKSNQYFSTMMRIKNRCLSPNKQKAVVRRITDLGITPLQLKLLVEECAGWHSSDEILDLPDSVDAMAHMHISNMYKKYGHNKELVLYALALIASTPYGITEEELQTLLLQFDTVADYFVSEDRYHHQKDKLPFVVWSRLFYDLKGCLTLAKSNGHIVVKFGHQVFHRVILDHYANYYKEATWKLIEYYESQGNYLNDLHQPNTRKALSLAKLLRQNNQPARLKALFGDLTYVDAVVQTGKVNEAISNLMYVIRTTPKDDQTAKLESLFMCLQNNRIMLNCYTKEFFSCYNNHTANGRGNTIHCLTDSTINQSPVFFAYPSSSRIKWNSAGTKYVVFYNSYAYICEQETNSELCKIYLEPQDGNRVIIKDVIWFENHLIGIITFSNTIELFDFQYGTPSFVWKYKSEYDNFSVGYSHLNKVLLLQEKDRILAYNIDFGNIEYSISLNHKYKVGFELCEATNTLIVKDSVKYIRFFDASNGKLIRRQKIAIKYNYDNLCDLILGDTLHQIDVSKWIVHATGTQHKYTILDADQKKAIYLHPPMIDMVRTEIMGEQMILLVYEDKIILLELFGNYNMRWLSIPYITDVAWRIKDQSISVMTSTGLFFFDIHDFTSFSSAREKCMLLSKNLFRSTVLGFRLFAIAYKNISNFLLKLFKLSTQLNNIWDYKYIFPLLEVTDSLDATLEKAPLNHSIASAVIHAEDGKQAVVYEEEEVIVVFDQYQKPILQIDNLKFSVLDNLLKIVFSPDSNHLLIWRNDSIQTINVITGKTSVNIDLRWRPALDVEFCSDSHISILLCSGERFTLKIDASSVVQLPDKLISSPHMDEYAGPYNYYLWEGTYKTFLLLDSAEFDLEAPHNNPNKWFKQRRVYHGKKHWLYFKNGTFYLCGDQKREFKHEFYDFQKCLQFEMLSESKPIRMYLRQKNDLYSTLYEIENRYLILVTRLLNSIIVFDLNNMSVLSAYKLDGNIIGCICKDNGKTLELTLDKSPYHAQIQLNLDMPTPSPVVQ